MENRIIMDLKNNKCSIVTTNEVNNSETDIISNENTQKSQQQQQQENYETNQQSILPLQSIDKNLTVDDIIVNDSMKNFNVNNLIDRDSLDVSSSLINNEKMEFEEQTTTNIINNNSDNQINLIPISSIDLIKSLKTSPSSTSSSPIVDTENNQSNNQLIHKVQNDQPTTSLIAITQTTSAILPESTTTLTVNKTTINAITEITKKESESLKQQQKNYNNDNNEKKEKQQQQQQENNEKINCDNIKNFEKQQQQQHHELLQTTTATIAMEAAKAAATAAEKLENLISAVCINNENNESKSECYNNSNKQVLSDNDDQGIDIDVITISSSEENLMDNINLKDIEFEKFQEELLKTFKKGKSQQQQQEVCQKSIEEDEQQKLTENSLKKSLNLQRTHSKTESVLEYLNSVEPSVTEIQEKLIEFDGVSNTAQSSDNGSSLCSTNVLNDSESEEDDQLKPLMQDNHTIVVNHEFFVYNNSNDKYQQNQHYNEILLNKRLNNNNNNNNNTCSSTDSDLSTQFDHRDLTTMSQNSLEDYNDSGLDTLSQPFINKSSTKEIHLKQLGPVPPAPATTPVTGVPIMDNNMPFNASVQQESEENEIREIDTLSPIEIPDDKLCEEIVEQVEYYFSNDSILKDAFLLKHVRRNKEGFVSLKLVSSFKRVRQFTKDWRVVGLAVERKSKRIELNSIGTKIRRLDPLPNFDETMPSRTIVVCDLPFEKLSIDKITDIFSKCGEIALVRILKPGMQIPVDVRQFMNKYPEMQQKECALVEFVDSASARFAKSMQGNYKIFEMVAPKKKTGKKSITTITKFIENYKYPDTNYERTRGGIDNGHHYHQNYNNSHGQNINYNNNNNQQSHNIHYNQILQNNNNNFENEYRSKLRSNYDIRNSQQHIQQQQNQESHLQNYVYQPPHMQQRRFSASNDQENNNRDHMQNINNLNNQINNNFGGINNNNNSNSNLHFSHYPPRRVSTSSVNDLQSRKYSSCSEGYSSCSEYSRRPSLTSSSQDSSSRKTSASCSDYCPCSRRTSQCSDIYRKISQTSDIVSSSPNRRFSNGSFHGFERQYSNPNDPILLSNSHTNNNINNNTMRRVSFDSNYDRKISSSSINNNNNNINNYNNTINNNNNNNNQLQQQQQQNNGQYICENHYRKYSNNGFDPNRKLSYTDQYFNGRRISTDSGYDRKLSFSSDISSTSTSPRSRANSFILPSQHKTAAEILVRTPIGPDGSKGFASRARKVGQIQSVI